MFWKHPITNLHKRHKSDMQKMTIQAYGIARDIFNGNEAVMEVQMPLTVETLKDNLVAQYPALAKLKSFAIAVNQSYQTDDFLISSEDEVVLIPPVSGG